VSGLTQRRNPNTAGSAGSTVIAKDCDYELMNLLSIVVSDNSNKTPKSRRFTNTPRENR
jgi:hypothetical protein